MQLRIQCLCDLYLADDDPIARLGKLMPFGRFGPFNPVHPKNLLNPLFLRGF